MTNFEDEATEVSTPESVELAPELEEAEAVAEGDSTDATGESLSAGETEATTSEEPPVEAA
jgi:hypothetical protein